MRVMGVDFGAKRIGLAVSDATGTLARPWRTISAGPTPQASAADLAALVSSMRTMPEFEPEGIGAIVVGVPHRLNGEDTHLTKPALEFARALAELSGVIVRMQDERLTSHEAESRLAERERDWRKRKAKIDAAAAAVILQDYLDAQTSGAAAGATRA